MMGGMRRLPILSSWVAWVALTALGGLSGLPAWAAGTGVTPGPAAAFSLELDSVKASLMDPNGVGFQDLSMLPM